LKGRRLGIPEFQMTAMVWLKGIFSDDFGVKVTDVDWISGGLEEPGREERYPLKLPPQIRIRPSGPDQTLSRMLDAGEIDALMAARTPSPFVQGSPRVKRLFEDFVGVERDYFRRTGIFPIM